MKNQKGFGILGILLVFVAVGLIAGTGWYVYNSKNKNADQKSNQESSETTREEKTIIAKPKSSPTKPSEFSVDGSTFYNLASLATTDDQKGIVNSIYTSCLDSYSGNSKVKSSNLFVVGIKVFFEDERLFKQDGNFARVSVGCYTPAISDDEQYSGRQFFLHTDTAKSYWVIDAITQEVVDCDEVEPYNYPPTVVEACYDTTTNTERAPR